MFACAPGFQLAELFDWIKVLCMGEVSAPSMLLRLPTSLGRCVLSQWLDIKSIARLDSAYCGPLERDRYQEVLHRFEILEIDVTSTGMLSWMTKREITCTIFKYNLWSRLLTSRVIAELDEFIQSTAKHLKSVCIRSDNETNALLLDRIATAGTKLNKLEIGASVQLLNGGASNWLGHFAGVLANSANTLTELYFVQPSRKGGLSFLKSVRLSALQKVVINISCDKDLQRICRAAPNLGDLTICHVTCSDVGFAAIGEHCHELRSLKIVSTGSSRLNEGLAAIAEGCRKLEHFFLEDCENLTDDGVIAVARYCTALTEIDITDCLGLTDESLIAIGRSLGCCLVRLSIWNCPTGMTDAGLTELALHCTSLRFLDICNSDSYMFEPMMAAIPLLKNLTELNMAYCTVDDAMLVLISEHMPYLEHLDVVAYGDPQYATRGLVALVRGCKRLRVLKMAERNGAVSKLAAELRPALNIDVNIYN